MGSLKILHPNLNQKNNVAVFHIRKPALLDVVQRSCDPNHSPLGSPPTEKKRIRRYSNSLVTTKPGSPGLAADKENYLWEERRSILKKIPVQPRCTSAPAVTRCSHNRKVNFNKQVLVQYIGDTGTSFEPLNVDQSNRQSFIARNALRRLQSQLQQPAFPVYKDSHQSASSSSPSSMSSSSTTSYPQQSHVPSAYSPEMLSSTVSGNNNPLLSKNVNISFSQSPRNNHETTMKFVVFMGPQYDPSNIVVKANMSGTRLRVVASLKALKDSNAAGSEQYNERFQLPMQVDPYKVEARLDARGYLTVTAPLTEPHAAL